MQCRCRPNCSRTSWTVAASRMHAAGGAELAQTIPCVTAVAASASAPPLPTPIRLQPGSDATSIGIGSADAQGKDSVAVTDVKVSAPSGHAPAAATLAAGLQRGSTLASARNVLCALRVALGAFWISCSSWNVTCSQTRPTSPCPCRRSTPRQLGTAPPSVWALARLRPPRAARL